MSRQIVKVGGHYIYDDAPETRRTPFRITDQRKGPNKQLIATIVIGFLIACGLAGAIADVMLRQTKTNEKTDTLETQNKASGVRLDTLEGEKISSISDDISSVSKTSLENATALEDRLDAMEKILNNIVQGNWAAWASWSSCSVTCGIGVTSRKRTCVSQNGIIATNCAGDDFEVNSCILQLCPVQGNWTAWASWSSCSATCGIGVTSRKRTCVSQNGIVATNCAGDDFEVNSCILQLCPVQGNWTAWASWSSCSVTCGIGVTSRKRTCGSQNGIVATNCAGDDFEVNSCILQLCPDRGTTYVRWGKTSCSGNNGTELVYDGYAAGGYFDHKGAAVNYLCLPKEPLWPKNYNDTAEVGGLLYGAEYQFESQRTQFPNAGQDHDVPCAVCRSPRPSVLMIPGRNLCYDGWTLEYHGYLMSGSYDHAAGTEYACVDENADSVVGGAANDNGKLFYYVEGRCGSLQCPPYVQFRELSCVVCSK